MRIYKDKVIPIELIKWSKETQEVFSETMKKMLAWWFPWKYFLKQYLKKIASLLDYFISSLGITNQQSDYFESFIFLMKQDIKRKEARHLFIKYLASCFFLASCFLKRNNIYLNTLNYSSQETCLILNK